MILCNDYEYQDEQTKLLHAGLFMKTATFIIGFLSHECRSIYRRKNNNAFAILKTMYISAQGVTSQQYPPLSWPNSTTPHHLPIEQPTFNARIPLQRAKLSYINVTYQKHHTINKTSPNMKVSYPLPEKKTSKRKHHQHYKLKLERNARIYLREAGQLSRLYTSCVCPSPTRPRPTSRSYFPAARTTNTQEAWTNWTRGEFRFARSKLKIFSPWPRCTRAWLKLGGNVMGRMELMWCLRRGIVQEGWVFLNEVLFVNAKVVVMNIDMYSLSYILQNYSALNFSLFIRNTWPNKMKHSMVMIMKDRYDVIFYYIKAIIIRIR